MDHLSGQSHEIQTESFENMLNIPSSPKANQENKKSIKQQQEAAEQALKCPRCDSTNTKFCYYNNYSLSQPRYFCKSCRRYWTKGGTLRNVPVGGGCRKNKRSSPSSISSPPLSSSSSLKRSHNSNSNPIIYDHPSSTTDLTLAFAKLQNQTNGQMGLFDYYSHSNFQNMYYGFGNGSYENGGVPNFEEYSNNNNASSTAAAAMKQELCINNGDQNMAMWGFPWQFNNYNNGGLDSAGGRESWNFNGNNNNGTFFHGLLNSPLM